MTEKAIAAALDRIIVSVQTTGNSPTSMALLQGLRNSVDQPPEEVEKNLLSEAKKAVASIPPPDIVVKKQL